MITTVANYCKTRGVSRQFVYQYIKKGKFKLIEVPKFIKINEEMIEMGTEKVLDVPDSHLSTSALTSDFEKFININTKDKKLIEFYKKSSSIEDKKTKNQFIADFKNGLNDADKIKFEEANNDFLANTELYFSKIDRKSVV